MCACVLFPCSIVSVFCACDELCVLCACDECLGASLYACICVYDVWESPPKRVVAVLQTTPLVRQGGYSGA